MYRMKDFDMIYVEGLDFRSSSVRVENVQFVDKHGISCYVAAFVTLVILRVEVLVKLSGKFPAKLCLAGDIAVLLFLTGYVASRAGYSIYQIKRKRIS